MSPRPRTRANGEGSIWQLAPKRWAGQRYVTDATGTRKRRTVYGATKRDVLGKLSALLADEQAGLVLPLDRRTVGEYLAWWLRDVVIPSRRPTTVRTYSSVVGYHLIPGLGGLPLQTLARAQVQAYYARLSQQGASANTIRLVHTVLHAALSRALDLGLIVRHPADRLQLPKPAVSPGVSLTVEEARRVLVAARGERMEALVVLALTTGLRRGELLGLRWQDVDLADGWLHVRQQAQRVAGQGWVVGSPKSAASTRKLRLCDLAVAALHAHRARQDTERLLAREWADRELVFANTLGRRLDIANFTRTTYLPLLARAGVPRVRLHDLRHTAGSLMAALGVPLKTIQSILGHSRLNVTADVYAHTLAGDQAAAMTAMDRLLGE